MHRRLITPASTGCDIALASSTNRERAAVLLARFTHQGHVDNGAKDGYAKVQRPLNASLREAPAAAQFRTSSEGGPFSLPGSCRTDVAELAGSFRHRRAQERATLRREDTRRSDVGGLNGVAPGGLLFERGKAASYRFSNVPSSQGAGCPSNFVIDRSAEQC